MKFTKTLAAIAAASLAVSSLAVSAFAADALVSMTVPENSNPQDAGQVNLWELPFDDSVEAWAGKVDKAVATITTEAYANGVLGGNTVANNGWASSDQIESSEAGTHQWVWDSIGGLQTKDADGNSNGYFKVEVWWMNALGEEGNQTPATLTIDKVDFYDKAGDLLATYPAAADTDTKPAEPVAPADVKIANSGRTVIDSGLVRTNIINEWTGNDADVIADKAAFAGANKISVKFTVTNFTTPFKAWIAMADSKWECQFQGEGDERNANAKCTPVEVTGNGTYVVTIDLDKVIDGVAFISVCTDLKAADGDAIPTIAIDQIKINEEITVKPGESDPTKPGESDPTKPGESDPVKPGESDPVKPGESDPVKPGDCSGEPVNPPTGAAVAVIPAALAAAAAATTGIVLKKRSK